MAEVEKSGVHITAEDSGWPVGDVDVEPGPTKDGTGNDPHPKAEAVADGEVTVEGS